MAEHGEMSGASVRVAATRADAELAGKLLDDFLAEFDTPSPGAAKFTERLATAIAADDGLLVLMAYADGAPVGLAVLAVRPTCFVDGRAIMLEELYVVPKRRGQGIGSALLRRAITEAQTRGVEFFEVGVDEGDVAARRFYERHGFTNAAAPGSDERMLYFEQELGPG
jgi:GNAT superfamily N-acetyltransferase